MSAAWQFYIITLLVYFGVNLIAGWSLNLQFGITGIRNFCFIIFQSIGAYVAGVTTLGRSSLSFEHYILGSTLPWPVPIALAGVAGAVLAAIVGLFALRPMNRDFQAMVMLMVVLIATTVVTAETGWFNGADGIDGVPRPLQSFVSAGLIGYGWFYVAVTAAFCLVTFFVINRIVASPYGRKLRAVRENPVSAAGLGINVHRENMLVFIVGGAVAAVSGAILVQFIGAWAPSEWGIFETFLYLVALTVGGLANNAGVALGTAVVLTGILEGVQYLPTIGSSSLIGAVQLMAIGLLLIAFLWFRPQGLIPERRRQLAAATPARIAASNGASAVPAGRDANLDRQGRLFGRLDGSRTPWNGAGRPRADATPQIVLELDDVSRSFGGVQAVAHVSLSLPTGQIVGLIGPNGAGKSSLLNLIAGLDHPDSGTIRYAGTDISRTPAHRVARMGMVRTFQLSSEFERLTVLENVLVAAPHQVGGQLSSAMLGKAHWRRDERRNIERARELLERFQLGSMLDEYAAELSGGQKRLLEVARALMAEPRVLLLDEPLAGVAPGLRGEVEDHLISLREEGLTMLMCEHELDTIERCSDSVIVMALGRVLASGTMDEIRSSQEVIDAYLVG